LNKELSGMLHDIQKSFQHIHKIYPVILQQHMKSS